MSVRPILVPVLCLVLLPGAASAQPATVGGDVRDETGAALTGVSVELRSATGESALTTTDAAGSYHFARIAPGQYQLAFTLLNFATVRREVVIAASPVQGDTVLQLEQRPLMRDGEVLETVPGMIVTQHSGEGKANQYFLRGFNLDHGTDFATVVAGMPVNMPTHAHGQGYTDLNFLIPELVTGVQFSKGPYYADQGDFATAGSSNVNYANLLDRPIVRLGA